MKKIICFILILTIFITALASCKGVTVIEEISETETETETVNVTGTEQITDAETEPEDEIDHRYDWQYEYDLNYDNISVEGDYVFNNAGINGRSIILKRNVHTGECTAVCTDPFCKHDSASCPFFETTYVAGIGNTMYGVMRDDNINKYVLYSFNAETDKKETVYESAALINDLYQYKYYLFFRPTDKGILRLDTRTGETVKIKSQPGKIATVTCGLIVWTQEYHDGRAATFTATDLLGNDPRPYNIYIYNGKLHGTVIDEETGKSSYVQLDRSGNVEKILIDNSYRGYIVGNNFIYFGIDEDQPLHYNAENRSNGDIYIAPIDTFESRLLCHVEEVVPYAIASSYLNVLMTGDWVAFIALSKDPDDKEKKVSPNDMIIVNMKTGEYHISRYTE